MLRKLVFLGALAAFVSSAACYVEPHHYPYNYYNRYGLVTIAPGVSVVADYDYPVFYSAGSFWLFDRGLWYRSAHPYGGWVYSVPPPAVLGLNNPSAYVHYHPYGYRPIYRSPAYRS
jgi:hypothetical protein